jgi:hypothetical protein
MFGTADCRPLKKAMVGSRQGRALLKLMAIPATTYDEAKVSRLRSAVMWLIRVLDDH